MDVSRKTRFGGVKVQRACSLTDGLWCRRISLLARMAFAVRGSYLHIGLDALLPYRIVPVPV
jgi:hypothetical protein